MGSQDGGVSPKHRQQWTNHSNCCSGTKAQPIVMSKIVSLRGGRHSIHYTHTDTCSTLQIRFYGRRIKQIIAFLITDGFTAGPEITKRFVMEIYNPRLPCRGRVMYSCSPLQSFLQGSRGSLKSLQKVMLNGHIGCNYSFPMMCFTLIANRGVHFHEKPLVNSTGGIFRGMCGGLPSSMQEKALLPAQNAISIYLRQLNDYDE